MNSPLLTVRDLTHRFNGRAEIAFGSFTLNAGSILLLRGESGCGKSTLLHLLGGVLSIAANSGSAVLDGLDIAAMTASARDSLRPQLVGWMPQRQLMINSLSVLDTVLLPMALLGGVDTEVRRRATSLLDSLAIAELATQRSRCEGQGRGGTDCRGSHRRHQLPALRVWQV